MNGSELIKAERERQISQENWTDNHDDRYVKGELLDASISYVRAAINPNHRALKNAPNEWPWDAHWWKPSDDVIRNLVKAGALIAAEIDRLIRLNNPANPNTKLSRGSFIEVCPYEAEQLSYMGGGQPGCGGFVESLRLVVCGNNRFFVQEYVDDTRGKLYRFLEFESADEAKKAASFSRPPCLANLSWSYDPVWVGLEVRNV